MNNMVGSVTVEVSTGQRTQMHMLVMSEQPLGVDVVLGIAHISALSCVVVKSSSEVHFCVTRRLCDVMFAAPLVVDASDYGMQFYAAFW